MCLTCIPHGDVAAAGTPELAAPQAHRRAAADPVRTGAGSRIGVADRMRREPSERSSGASGGGANTLRCALGKMADLRLGAAWADGRRPGSGTEAKHRLVDGSRAPRRRTAISLGCVTPARRAAHGCCVSPKSLAGKHWAGCQQSVAPTVRTRPGIRNVGVRVPSVSAGADWAEVLNESGLGVTGVVRDTGREVVQAYVEPHSPEWGRPLRTLAAFAAVTAKPGRPPRPGWPSGPGVRALRRGVRRLGPAAWRVHRPHRQSSGLQPRRRRAGTIPGNQYGERSPMPSSATENSRDAASPARGDRERPAPGPPWLPLGYSSTPRYAFSLWRSPRSWCTTADSVRGRWPT